MCKNPLARYTLTNSSKVPVFQAFAWVENLKCFIQLFARYVWYAVGFVRTLIMQQQDGSELFLSHRTRTWRPATHRHLRWAKLKVLLKPVMLYRGRGYSRGNSKARAAGSDAFGDPGEARWKAVKTTAYPCARCTCLSHTKSLCSTRKPT